MNRKERNFRPLDSRDDPSSKDIEWAKQRSSGNKKSLLWQLASSPIGRGALAVTGLGAIGMTVQVLDEARNGPPSGVHRSLDWALGTGVARADHGPNHQPNPGLAKSPIGPHGLGGPGPVDGGGSDGIGITACVFEDNNENKIRDPGEEGLSGRKIDVQGPFTDTTLTTGSDGCSRFQGEEGWWRFNHNPEPGWRATTKTIISKLLGVLRHGASRHGDPGHQAEHGEHDHFPRIEIGVKRVTEPPPTPTPIPPSEPTPPPPIKFIPPPPPEFPKPIQPPEVVPEPKPPVVKVVVIVKETPPPAVKEAEVVCPDGKALPEAFQQALANGDAQKLAEMLVAIKCQSIKEYQDLLAKIAASDAQLAKALEALGIDVNGDGRTGIDIDGDGRPDMPSIPDQIGVEPGGKSIAQRLSDLWTNIVIRFNQIDQDHRELKGDSTPWTQIGLISAFGGATLVAIGGSVLWARRRFGRQEGLIRGLIEQEAQRREEEERRRQEDAQRTMEIDGLRVTPEEFAEIVPVVAAALRNAPAQERESLVSDRVREVLARAGLANAADPGAVPSDLAVEETINRLARGTVVTRAQITNNQIAEEQRRQREQQELDRLQNIEPTEQEIQTFAQLMLSLLNMAIPQLTDQQVQLITRELGPNVIDQVRGVLNRWGIPANRLQADVQVIREWDQAMRNLPEATRAQIVARAERLVEEQRRQQRPPTPRQQRRQEGGRGQQGGARGITEERHQRQQARREAEQRRVGQEQRQAPDRVAYVTVSGRRKAVRSGDIFIAADVHRTRYEVIEVREDRQSFVVLDRRTRRQVIYDRTQMADLMGQDAQIGQ